MRLFLFCNAQYGAPFERVVTELAARRRIPLTIVTSGRSLRGRSWRRRAYVRLQARLRSLRLPWQRGTIRRVLVDDVNNESFTRQIAPGDVGVISGFDQIFRPEPIERFDLLVNVHPSLLPLYRGPVPSHWCLVNGESASGYTLHRVTPRIDAGEVLFQEIVPVMAGDDAGRLDARIADAGALTVSRFLDSLFDGAPWVPSRVDAHAVYREHLGYRSFPSRTA